MDTYEEEEVGKKRWWGEPGGQLVVLLPYLVGDKGLKEVKAAARDTKRLVAKN